MKICTPWRYEMSLMHDLATNSNKDRANTFSTNVELGTGKKLKFRDLRTDSSGNPRRRVFKLATKSAKEMLMKNSDILQVFQQNLGKIRNEENGKLVKKDEKKKSSIKGSLGVEIGGKKLKFKCNRKQKDRLDDAALEDPENAEPVFGESGMMLLGIFMQSIPTKLQNCIDGRPISEKQIAEMKS